MPTLTAAFTMRHLSALRAAAAAPMRRFASSLGAGHQVVFQQYGSPSRVLRVEEAAAPGKPKDSEVVVRMLAAPINPADLNIVEGTYPQLPSQLPAVGGTEGVGVVVDVGAGVKGLAEGDWVVPAKAPFGTWRSYAVCSASDVSKVASDIPIEYAATLSVNPCTALRLLSDFADLKEGDVIVQNGANSAAGLAVVQMAAARGIHTVNIVRDRPDLDDEISKIKGLGGTIAVSDKYAATSAMQRLVADLPAAKLGLNCVGGRAATEVARLLGEGGALVTYGGMSRRPVTIPTSALIFKNISLHGFWLARWLSEHSAADSAAMRATVEGMVRDGKLKSWIERHPLAKFDRALARTNEPYRSHKVLLTMDDGSAKQ